MRRLLGSLAAWLDDRTGWRGLRRHLLDEPLPAGTGWWFTLGSLLLFGLTIQLVTGILLALYYAPTPDHAWDSVRFVTTEVRAGSFLRGLHHWAASLVVVAAALHLIRVVFFGSYKKPREMNWLIGLALLLVILAFGLTGYLLPWDQRAYWATVVTINIARLTPLAGDAVAWLLQGGAEIGALTLTRWYAVHVVVLPVVLAVLVVAHLYLLRRHGISGPVRARPGPSRMFFPYQAWRDLTVAVAAGVFLAVLAWRGAPALESPADPTSSDYVPRPEWYFLGLFQLLKYFPGHWEVVGALVVPGLAALFLALLPWLDRSRTRDPRARRLILGLFTAGLAGVVTLTTIGALDRPAAQPNLWSVQEQAGAILISTSDRCTKCHGPDRMTAAVDPRHMSRPPDWLAAHVADPEVIGPGVREVPATSSESEVAAIRAALTKMRSIDPPTIDDASRQAIVLFNRQCLSCHVIGSVGGTDGPDLTHVGEKLDPGVIERRIVNPADVQIDASMPAFGGKLTAAEIHSLALWLGTKKIRASAFCLNRRFCLSATCLNLASLLEHQARLTPDRHAIVLRPFTFTYAQLDAMASRVAAGLRALGLGPGDHIALSCPNTPHFPIAYYGILKMGGIVVPLNVLLKPREISAYLADSDARALMVFEGTPELPMAQMASAACNERDAPQCRYLIVMTIDPAAPSPIDHALTLGRVMEGQPGHFPAHATAPDDTAVMLFTSGTTGQSKGAELTHFNMTMNAMASRDMLLPTLDSRRDAQNVTLATLPLFHSTAQTAQMNAGISGGWTVILLRRFEPAAVLHAFEHEQVNCWIGVPTMYWSLLQHARQEKLDVSKVAASLRCCVSGGAPMPLAVLQDFERTFNVRILEGYGLSETSPVACFNQVFKPSKPGTVGFPIGGCEVRIVDDQDGPVATGERGEIVIRGHNVMKGYYKQPEATAEALRGGWFHTGDVGVLDEDGYLTIVDRKKDMLIRGGTNVYPREIEEVLMTHPAVSLAGVIGVPHERLGEEVKAFIVLKPGATLTAEELITWSKQQLAAFKYPRIVEFRESLPMGATGKVLKRALKE